ncbi:hypothetical protein D3C72_2142120 [compost metagenome]
MFSNQLLRYALPSSDFWLDMISRPSEITGRPMMFSALTPMVRVTKSGMPGIDQTSGVTRMNNMNHLCIGSLWNSFP